MLSLGLHFLHTLAGAEARIRSQHLLMIKYYLCPLICVTLFLYSLLRREILLGKLYLNRKRGNAARAGSFPTPPVTAAFGVTRAQLRSSRGQMSLFKLSLLCCLLRSPGFPEGKGAPGRRSMPSLNCIITAQTPDIRSTKNDSFFFLSFMPGCCQRMTRMQATGLCLRDPAFSTERHVVFS